MSGSFCPTHAPNSVGKLGGMNEADMKRRTREFALRIIKLVEALPSGRIADVLGKQLLRSATSVGANYRPARRAKSRADFIHKLTIVEEEADECGYWLDLMGTSGLIKPARLEPLLKESDELTVIVVATIVSAKRKRTAS